MSKYDSLKILIKRKARVNHVCTLCGKMIEVGEFYFSEELKDKHIKFFRKNKFCANCCKNSTNNIG
jgi:hypothetical protein